jgi:hypothetical protein
VKVIWGLVGWRSRWAGPVSNRSLTNVLFL